MLTLNGLAAQLFEEIKGIAVVDCHEHLPTEEERLKQQVDVTKLFQHYCKGDLEAAGLRQGAPQDEVFDASKPLMPRWRTLKPYVEAIRHGSYAWPAFAYVRDVLGFEDINDDTVDPISEKLRADQTPGLYKRVMQDLCGIETAILCTDGVVAGDQPFFVYLMRDKTLGFDNAAVDRLEKSTGITIRSLDDAERAIRQNVADEAKGGAVGCKIGAAYRRSIEYVEVPKCDADAAFCRMRRSVGAQLAEDDQRTLENFLVRKGVEACIDADICVVIHTGYQAGNRNDIRMARATHLWHLLKSYPEARFDLFHGSFPYVEDMTVLGKYFGNVTLNMCWMHIMGPAVSRRALDQWLDAVPATKIFAFGGDYSIVEKVYGHLELARADVAMVLADKITQGRMTESQALNVARLLFHDNAKAWYRL